MNAQEKSARIEALRAQIERKPAGAGITARERLALLFDEGSFVEVGAFVRQRPTEFGVSEDPEGVVTGYGAVDGVLVFAFAQDPAVNKGAVSEMHARKIKTVIEMAIKADAPVVSFLDSCGLRLGEGIDALAGYGEILSLCSEMQGVIPHVCVVSGVCAGAMSFLPAFADYTVMLKNAELFLSAPSVVQARFGQKTGDAASAYESGLASLVCDTDADAVAAVKDFFTAFGAEDPTDDVNRLTPAIEDLISLENYNVSDVIAQIADNGICLEFMGGYAKNIVTGLIHLDGTPCGVIANNPAEENGNLNSAACDKAAKFMEFCDSYDIPVITLVDTDGFAPEVGANISESARLLAAYASSDGVKITLITGRAYGAGYLSMGAKHTGADVVLAYPTASIAALPADTGAVFLGDKKIAASDDPIATREELIASYGETLASPLQAARRGYVDDIVDIVTTRQLLISSLNLFLQEGDC
ncbi:MAG: methylmalonyl-CoA carboxyltransferase [Clostridia bacterium]|nr:methylmalonyl-CoA carboxyltransferase [Clostridia bacterium]